MTVFADKPGISVRPMRVRTRAPKRKTLVVRFHFNWNHVSVIAGIARTCCMFWLHDGSIHEEVAVDRFKALKARFMQALLVIRDGLEACRSGLVRYDLGPLHATARNKLKSAQKRPSITAACWMRATI